MLVNCLQCHHFYITWDMKFPRGCKKFNIKTRELPSNSVLASTGMDCPFFVQGKRKQSPPTK